MSAELTVKGLTDVAMLWFCLPALLSDARLHVVGNDPQPTVNRLNTAIAEPLPKLGALTMPWRRTVRAVLVMHRLGESRLVV
jgi:hypothetical protein